MLKLVYRIMANLVMVVVIVVSTRMAANYFAVHTNIDPLSKSASLLTLLFMLFTFLGIIICIVQVFIFRKLQ
ncbi:hypothetical protein BACCIP111895_02000 [Neobacillus rhizosphaerae]|uniref:Uncharacterized protein n=1 Tax=Neobacillus rhizosphaerae TaxID=2880965 RepID=A0ABN8KN57_9BACI|nr:hypothetical protein [Neobacillus rhizosphaerae]CAH2714824.1 hypothetical protein BACCIP111895_02000 [Neobacillus rhizosphaerae]